MRVTALAFAALFVVATIIPFARNQAWWIRVFEFPRLTLVGLGGVAVVGLLASGELGRPVDVAALIACLLALVVQIAWMAPYTPIWKKEVADARASRPEETLCILVSNVLQKNRRSAEWRDMVTDADADIVVAVETDGWWADEALRLEESYPHRVMVPQDNTYGMLLLSRLPLIEPHVRFLVEDDIPSIHVTVCLPSGDHVHMSCIHPRPPAPQEDTDTVERDAELVLLGREVAAMSHPVVVAGDLNDVAWSRTTRLFQKISGLLDPRRGRSLLSTYHAKNPLFRYPLDHVFHSSHFRLVSLERLKPGGSDHFPVRVSLHLDPSGAHVHEVPVADAADLEEAEEKVDHARGAMAERQDSGHSERGAPKV